MLQGKPPKTTMPLKIAQKIRLDVDISKTEICDYLKDEKVSATENLRTRFSRKKGYCSRVNTERKRNISDVAKKIVTQSRMHLWSSKKLYINLFLISPCPPEISPQGYSFSPQTEQLPKHPYSYHHPTPYALTHQQTP